jgi:hypothetical protein
MLPIQSYVKLAATATINASATLLRPDSAASDALASANTGSESTTATATTSSCSPAIRVASIVHFVSRAYNLVIMRYELTRRIAGVSEQCSERLKVCKPRIQVSLAAKQLQAVLS